MQLLLSNFNNYIDCARTAVLDSLVNDSLCKYTAQAGHKALVMLKYVLGHLVGW